MSLKDCAIATAVSLLLLLVIAARVEPMTYDHPDFAQDWDHHSYIAMAEQPLGTHRAAPFCWRVGAPTLAKLVPADTQTSFRLITFVALLLTGPALVALLRALGFPRGWSFAALPLFYSLHFAVAFNLWAFWYTDATIFLFVVLAITAAAQGRALRFVLLLAAGALFKESVIFVAPLWYTLHASRLVEPRRALQTAALTAPAVAVLVALRLLIPQANPDPYTYPEVMRMVLGRRSWWTVVLALTTFGPLLPLVLGRHNRRWLLVFSPFLLLVVSQLLFAVNTERLLVLAFPAVIVMQVTTLQVLVGRLPVALRAPRISRARP